MAEYQTPAEIAEAHITNVETRALLEADIISWYNFKIEGIKTTFKTVMDSMDDPTPEEVEDAIDNLVITEEEES